MKCGINGLLLTLATFVIASQSTVHLTRHIQLGEENKYKVHFSGSAVFGDLDVTQTKDEKVVKVYDNGDADVLTTILSRQILVNDSKISRKMDPPSTERVDKNGVPLDPKDQESGGDQLTNCVSVLFDRDLKVGDTIKVDKASGKDKTTGSFKIVSLDEGELRAEANLKITRVDDDPTTFKGTFLVNIADSKLDKINGSFENFDIGEGHSLDDGKYTIERIHS
jgi:hypothetical protein